MLKGTILLADFMVKYAGFEEAIILDKTAVNILTGVHFCLMQS